MCNWKLLTQSYPTLCDPMDCSPPGSSVQGILQARILEWVAISFSRGSSQPRDWTQVSCIAGRLYRLRQPGVIGLLISKNCFWYNFYQRVVISYKFSEGQVFCLPISMICVCAFATQSCLTLCKPMDCSPKGSCLIFPHLNVSMLETSNCSPVKFSGDCFYCLYHCCLLTW